MPTHPILLDVPEVIDTPRLLIRCPQPGDGRTVYESVLASLPALREFPASLPWAMAEPSQAESEKFCREGQAHYRLRQHLPMLLFLKGSHPHMHHVGNSGLHALDWPRRCCEIGYWGHSAFRGQGYITEAVQAISAFAFTHLNMRRIEALPDDANGPSCRVCERSSYTLEGTLRNNRVTPDGVWRSTRVYARLA